MADDIQPKKREIRQVATGQLAERKPGFFEKVAKFFFVDTAKDVGNGVLMDVILPGLRDMFYDAIVGGASRAVYGNGSPTTRTYTNKPGTRDYGRYSRPRTIGFQNDAPEEKPIQAKTTSNELIFNTREEALIVKNEFLGTLQEYGVVSVHDLHRMAGIERTWAQDSFGWDVETLAPEDVTITHTREGWLLHLPRPMHIEI